MIPRDTGREATGDAVYERAYQAVYECVLVHSDRLTLTALHILDAAAKEGLLETDPTEGETRCPER